MNFLALSIGLTIILLYTLLVIYDLPYNGLNWNITNNSSLLSSVTKNTSKLSPVYIITPTYPRVVQLSELTRMAYVLQNVKKIHWIVADDVQVPTRNVVNFLKQVNVKTHYIQSPIPEFYHELCETEPKKCPKGVANRLAGLDWVYKHAKDTGDMSGAIYFADDDNTYDIKLFEEIRKTKTVSAFPVGIVAGQYVSTPVLNKNGKFIKFFDGWNGGRKYIIDMAGFAVGVNHYVKMADKFNEVKRNFTIMKFRRGYEENSFLINMRVPPKKFEFLCDNCQKVYVWHTQTKTPIVKKGLNITVEDAQNTNLGNIKKFWCLSGEKIYDALNCTDIEKSKKKKSKVKFTR